MDISGYADHPIEKIEDDSLKMSDYVNGLSDFIKCCETPMTIAIKGEWGSGKTSLMRMIQNNLTKKTAAKDSPKSTVAEQTAKDISKDTVAVQTANNASENMVAEQTANNATKATDTKQTANNVLEEPVIIPVWFDTWKFSAMELGNQLAISMLGEILHALDCDSITIRAMLGGIAKLAHATLPLITEVSMGFASLGEAMRNLIRINEKESFGTEIRELQNRFHEIVQRKIKREKARRNNDQEYLKETKDPNFIKKTKFYYRSIKEKLSYKTNYECLPKDRVIIFIDDLDRIQPDKAVDLLEILKAFLDCPNCVFVLAIDFELVSLGVNIKYKNNLSAEKSKDFFDKMVQLPFTMPTTNYDLDSYVKKLNVSEEDTFIEEIKQFIELSVGVNPRKIKRIFNTYNLNRNNVLSKFPDMNKEFVNKCVFALACMQEHYPVFLTFLVNNDFDRFIFEPFFQPDNSAVYLYHDIFENRDNSYIKQQLEGLRRFVSEFRKAFALDNKNTEQILKEHIQKSKQRVHQQDFPINDGGNTVFRNKLKIQQSLIYMGRHKLRGFINLKANYDDFKKIIRLISVSNLGIVINPKLQDIADNNEWTKREFNIWFVKGITDIIEKETKEKWSVLTPIKADNGIRLSDIIGYKRFNTDMYFNYKYEFKVHEENINNICVDLVLHVYPNDDLHKSNIVDLIGKDPLFLLKTPNIKMSEDNLIYHYIDVIKIRNIEADNYNIGNDNITLMLDSIAGIILETLSFFQNIIIKGTDIADKYKMSIIRILIDRTYIEDCCCGHDPYKDRIIKAMDANMARPDINSFMTLLRNCLKEHPEQISLPLLKEVFGNKVVESLQAITE